MDILVNEGIYDILPTAILIIIELVRIGIAVCAISAFVMIRRVYKKIVKDSENKTKEIHNIPQKQENAE